MRPTSAWPGGYYASYHAYPYYPDFQRYEESIVGFQLNGEEDNYAEYLTKLKNHHAACQLSSPSSEFPRLWPQPTSDRREGTRVSHNERDQMQIDADLLTTIEGVELAGGFVFEWTDEWFKFTWNTIDYSSHRTEGICGSTHGQTKLTSELWQPTPDKRQVVPGAIAPGRGSNTIEGLDDNTGTTERRSSEAASGLSTEDRLRPTIPPFVHSRTTVEQQRLRRQPS